LFNKTQSIIIAYPYVAVASYCQVI
jgi:hypothetical protein